MPLSVPVDTVETLGRLAREERRVLLAAAQHEGLTAEEALECVQDALCALLADDATAELMRVDDVLAWVKVRVRNAARNFRRLHRRAKPHEPIDADHEHVRATALAEELLERAEDLLRLRMCVAELCEIQRAVITLRLLEERSGEDVAGALGLARGHVDVLVHRAKAALQVCMSKA